MVTSDALVPLFSSRQNSRFPFGGNTKSDLRNLSLSLNDVFLTSNVASSKLTFKQNFMMKKR